MRQTVPRKAAAAAPPDEDSAVDRTLLVVDDDEPFRTRLAQAMRQRGYDVVTAAGVREALAQVEEEPPAFAVVDLRLLDGYGLDVVPELRAARPDMRIVILTGYGNIASTVQAVKAGAVDYLAKPADADEVDAALRALPGAAHPPPPERPMSADRVRWEHINRVYELCDRNVSETARRLNMHRRTLQRILAKHSPRE